MIKKGKKEISRKKGKNSSFRSVKRKKPVSKNPSCLNIKGLYASGRGGKEGQRYPFFTFFTFLLFHFFASYRYRCIYFDRRPMSTFGSRYLQTVTFCNLGFPNYSPRRPNSFRISCVGIFFFPVEKVFAVPFYF